MLIDTHCHLHDRESFTPDQASAMLDRAHAKGVAKVICIGTNSADSWAAHDFAAQHDGVYWTYGIHPEYSGQEIDDGALLASKVLELDSLGGRGSESLDDESVPRTAEASKVPSSKLVAIGEIGLDYHYDGYDRAAQLRLFEQMLQLALDLNLPVSLHLREAFDDALGVLDNFPATRGVVHSFTGSKKDLKKLLARDFYVGVNGLVTYTTPALPPLEKMVLETDAPFLTPVPFRGTINEPSYVSEVAIYLSGKLGVALVQIGEQTTQNARKIFQI